MFLSRFGFLLLAVVSIQAAQNSNRIDEILNQLERVHHFNGVSISPNGEWITWTQEAAPGKNRIYLKPRNERGEAIPIATDSESSSESGAVWSADSQTLAFISNDGGSKQIWIESVSQPRKAKQLTHLRGGLADLRWSPDAHRIAFLQTETDSAAGPLAAVPAQTGVIGTGFENRRLAIVDVASGTTQTITTKELNIYEYSWAPDGKKFAAVAAPGPADNNWWIAKLYTVDAASGQMTELYKPPASTQIAVPRWSPDGSQVGFIGGIMSDEGFLGGDIFSVSSAGGAAKDLTPDIKISPNGFRWQSNREIVFTASVDGGGAIAHLNIASGTTEMIWKGNTILHEDGNYPNFALADDGKTGIGILADWQQAPEVWSGSIGTWEKTTNANADAKPLWGKSESVVWTSDGFRVQGWLLYPEQFDPGKRYPMVVSIHGGPAGERAPAWPSVHFDLSAMAGLGYFVFFPNPRGSYGEGEAFTRANVKDFGYGDLRDILSGVDAVVKKAPIDESRIGVAGWSYGGYMTMWTVTQTHRFRAAVAGAGIANWLSYYGENSIDEWMMPYFGASVYDDPKVYEKSSPMTFIKQVKTPTLVVVGERDGECPAPQSFEFWHALKNQGVATELVVYPGEGHSFRESKNRLDVLRRTLAWFDRYLSGAN